MRTTFIIATLTLVSVAVHAQTLREQSECAKAGERQFKRAGFSFEDANLYTHYNPKLGHCYAMFAKTTFDHNHIILSRDLVDGIEGTKIAQGMWVDDAIGHNPRALCEVNTINGDTKFCGNMYEFDALVLSNYGLKY
jgi:hypothetical protein